MNNVRHGRFAFFRSPTTPGGNPTTVPGSIDLGTFQVGGFSRFVGMFSGVGSMTFQWRMGVHSGDYQATSSIVINSGGVHLRRAQPRAVRELQHHRSKFADAELHHSWRTATVKAALGRFQHFFSNKNAFLASSTIILPFCTDDVTSVAARYRRLKRRRCSSVPW